MANQEVKYIAVRNWGKYQERIGKRGDARRPFIKMSTSLDSDPDYSQLTFFERQVLDGCRRLIGLHGQNLLNDPAYISRGLCAARKDRPHVPHAVRTLTLRGFLILTNQRDPFSCESNETKRNDTNDTKRSLPPSEGEDTQENQPQNQTDFFVCLECNEEITQHLLELHPGGGPTHLGCGGKVRFTHSHPEGVETVEPGDEVELPKSKAFEIED